MAVSDDWAVGDLAVCVDASPPRDLCGNGGIETKYARNLVEGRIYKVTTVIMCHCGKHQGLGDKAAWAGGDVNRFRKIRPDAREGNADDWREITKLHTRKVRA